ncbi:MAG: DUF6901 family protein [Bacteriovoracaceae bacterium]
MKVIQYLIEIEGKDTLKFEIKIDQKTLNYVNPYFESEETKAKLPAWTKLSNSQCSNCPLKEDEFSHCPAAANLHDIVSQTSGSLSYEASKVYVVTKNRTSYKKTDLQSGLLSLMGIVLASSECPHFDFLRPMAYFHLPFSDTEETFSRVGGFFLLNQYFNGKEVSLEGLKDCYKEIEVVNDALLARIREASKGDANLNAIVALNLFAQLLSMDSKQDFSSLKKFFTRE